jgi:hypothetical protein
MYCANCGEKNGQDSRFCANCGQSIKASHSDAKNKDTEYYIPRDSSINFVEIASSVDISMDLDGNTHSIADFENLCALIGKYAKTKSIRKILYNIYASNEYLVFFPASKDRSNMAMLGLLLGGGALGGAAVGLLQNIAKNKEQKESEIDLEKENILNNSFVYKIKDVSLKLKESTTSSGIFFGEPVVNTHFKVMGPAAFNRKNYRLEVNFCILGQCTDNTKNKPPAFNILTSKLGVTNPVIVKGEETSFPAEWSLLKK